MRGHKFEDQGRIQIQRRMRGCNRTYVPKVQHRLAFCLFRMFHVAVKCEKYSAFGPSSRNLSPNLHQGLCLESRCLRFHTSVIPTTSEPAPDEDICPCPLQNFIPVVLLLDITCLFVAPPVCEHASTLRLRDSRNLSATVHLHH